MKQKLETEKSVDDILAAGAKQEQHRKPATGKARQAKSLRRPVEDNPWHRPEPVITVPEQAPEPPTIIVCHIDPDDPATYGLDNRPFGDTPLREAPRVPLVALCQELVREHGPLTIDEMIQEIWGSDAVGTDDARWLKAQLCKWLTAAAKESSEQFYPKRHRNPARPNARLQRWGFWAEQQPPDRRYVAHNTEVLTAIAELRAELIDLTGALSDELVILQRELVTLRQVQSELLQRQNLLKEGFAAMLEKLTWNGEL